MTLEATPRIGGTTPVWDIPYPSSTDPVAAGAADMQAIAERVEAVLDQREKLLARIEVAATGSTVLDIDLIPQTHRHLRLVGNLKQFGGTVPCYTYLKFNGDGATANYIGWSNPSGGFRIPDLRYAADAQWTPQGYRITDYTAADRWKSITTDGSAAYAIGDWKGVAPLTRLTFSIVSATFAVGAWLELYGKEAL